MKQGQKLKRSILRQAGARFGLASCLGFALAGWHSINNKKSARGKTNKHKRNKKFQFISLKASKHTRDRQPTKQKH
jgi:hypothetical protein